MGCVVHDFVVDATQLWTIFFAELTHNSIEELCNKDRLIALPDTPINNQRKEEYG